jgi:hypothetical protein
MFYQRLLSPCIPQEEFIKSEKPALLSVASLSNLKPELPRQAPVEIFPLFPVFRQAGRRLSGGMEEGGDGPSLTFATTRTTTEAVLAQNNVAI